MAQPCVASRAARRRERARRVAVRQAQRQPLELLQLLHGVGAQVDEDVQIVDIHVDHEKEDIVHVPKAVQQERNIQQSVEVPMATKEIVHVPPIIPQECIIQQAMKQVVKAPIPRTQEEVVYEPTVKYDSIHGRYDGIIEADGDSLVIDGKKVALSRTRDPVEIPFTEHTAEYVRESTGVFLTTEKAELHLKAGATKVVSSAPAKDDLHTVVMGVNQGTKDSSMTCVSCASCSTNGLAPLVKATNDKFDVKRGLVTTVHAMTASQPPVDGSSKKDWRGDIFTDFDNAERARSILLELFEAGDISFEEFDRLWWYLNDEETYEADGD